MHDRIPEWDSFDPSAALQLQEYPMAKSVWDLAAGKFFFFSPY